MADTEGHMEQGDKSSARGGPDLADMQSLQAPSRPATEGDPADVERSVKESVTAWGIEVGSEDFDAMTQEAPHVGPTAGGG